MAQRHREGPKDRNRATERHRERQRPRKHHKRQMETGSQRSLCRDPAGMERQRESKAEISRWERNSSREGGGRDGGTRTRGAAQPLLPGSLRQPLSPAWRSGAGDRGQGSPPGRPVQGAAWGKLGGRIVISVGVLLNYTTSYLSPGGAAGGQTDGWTGRTDGGQGGRGGPGRPQPRW